MDSKEENIVTTTRSASLKTSQAPATQTKDLEFGGVAGRQRPLLGVGGGRWGHEPSRQWRERKGLSREVCEAARSQAGWGPGLAVRKWAVIESSDDL